MGARISGRLSCSKQFCTRRAERWWPSFRRRACQPDKNADNLEVHLRLNSFESNQTVPFTSERQRRGLWVSFRLFFVASPPSGMRTLVQAHPTCLHPGIPEHLVLASFEALRGHASSPFG